MLCVRWVGAEGWWPEGVGPRGVEAQRSDGPEGWGPKTQKTWRAQRVGSQRGGGPNGGRPKISRFYLHLPSHFRSFFPLGGLLVESRSRTAAMDHPKCAFGLLWGHLVKPRRLQRLEEKLQREDPSESKKGGILELERERATFWAVRRRRGPAEGLSCGGGVQWSNVWRREVLRTDTHNTHNTRTKHTTQDTHNAHTSFKLGLSRTWPE